MKIFSFIRRTDRTEHMIIGALLLSLGAYYAYTVLSLLLVFAAPLSPAAMPFTLLFSENVMMEISVHDESNTPLPEWWVAAARRLHRGDPEVLSSFVQHEMARREFSAAARDAEAAISLDPKSASRYAAYMSVREKAGNPVTVSEEMRLLAEGFLSGPELSAIEEGLAAYPPVGASALPDAARRLDALPSGYVPSYLAQIAYRVGLGHLPFRRDATIYWWRLAAALDPSTSYYAVEAAAVLLENGSRDEAARMLRGCQTNPSARAHCRLVESDVLRGVLPRAGALSDRIFDGPPFASP